MVRAKCVVMNPNRKGILGSASRKAILLYADYRDWETDRKSVV